MKKILFVFIVLSFVVACSKSETPASSTSFDPTKTNQEDPLKLGTGACKVDEKKDCDTKK